MKRKVLVICQKMNWDKGKPQVIKDWKKLHVYPYADRSEAVRTLNVMNKDTTKNPLHLRVAWIDIGKEYIIKTDGELK